MACTTTTSEINLEAAYIYWGREDSICMTPATGLAGGEHFTMSNQTTKYAFYTTVDTVGADPAIAGYTSVEVAVGAAYTVSDWTTAFKAAIEALDFTADISTDGLSIRTNTFDIGAPLEVVADVDTGFTFDNDIAGIGGSLGKTSDAIEASFEQTEFEVKSNQTGETLLGLLKTGSNATISPNLIELSNERLEFLIGGGYGDTHTIGSDVLVGDGSSKINANMGNYAGKLILHPIRLAADDRSRDLTFHKTVPKVSSLNWDGADSQKMAVEFKALLKEEYNSAINLWSLGNWRNDLR